MTSGDMLESLALLRVRLRGDEVEVTASVFTKCHLFDSHSIQHFHCLWGPPCVPEVTAIFV